MKSATPSLRATPSKEGEFSAFGIRSPSLEGVARSDGVAAANTSPKLNHLPHNPALQARARELRKAGNLSEVLFWNAVKNKQWNGLDFDRQRVIGNYIVDFYCHQHALVVEIDGSSHDDKQDYDQVRDEYLQALGLKVFHVRDVEVKQNLAEVLAFVLLQIKSATPPLGQDLKTATPPFGHPFRMKGNEDQLPQIPLQIEGVARSDGVAASIPKKHP